MQNQANHHHDVPTKHTNAVMSHSGPPQQFHSKPQTRRKKLWISLALLVVLGVAGWYYLAERPVTVREDESTFASTQQVVATVGEERIFQSDIDQRRSEYPPLDELETIILNRLIEESIIIQGAAHDGLIENPENLLDTPQRSQTERIELVSQIEETIKAQNQSIRGSLVSIFFMNEVPGPIGYEAGRRLASEKITQLNQQVRNGELTMEQAGQQISNDPELARVDPVYKLHAFSRFDTRIGEAITLDSDVDAAILSLSPGQVSPVLIGKDWQHEVVDGLNRPLTDQPKLDAIFMFAQVDERTGSNDSKTFQEWLEAKKLEFEIT